MPSIDAATAAASARAPEMVIASADLAGASDLLGRFARRAGGSGAIALLPEIGGGDDAAAAADESLAKPFTDKDLRLAVRRLATSGRAPRAQAPAEIGGERLTSKDLFGDVLAEMEREVEPVRAPSPPPPVSRPAPAAAARAVSSDVERALERTLSGLLKEEKPRPPAVKKRAGGVDDLISRTLSGLDVGERPRRPAPPPPASPPPAAASPAEPRSEPPPDSLPPFVLPPLVLPPLELPPPVLPPLDEPAPAPRASAAPPPAIAPPAAPAPRPLQPDEVERMLAAARTPAAEPRRTSREIDLSQLDALAHPKPREKTPEGFATQRVALPSALRGKSSPTEFGQYTLLERIAVGGMAEVWKARMKGVEGFQKTVAIKKILPHLTDSARLRHHVHRRGQARRAAQPPQHHPHLRPGQDRRRLLHRHGVRRRQGPALDPQHARAQGSCRCRSGLALLVGLAARQRPRLRAPQARLRGPRARPRAPRRLAAERADQLRGRHQALRLRHRQGGRQGVARRRWARSRASSSTCRPSRPGARPVDARSDIFSLGSLLFEMLTGRRLFAGESEMSVLDAVREGRIQAPRDLDPRLPLEVNALVLQGARARSPTTASRPPARCSGRSTRILLSLKPAPAPADLAAYLQAAVRRRSTGRCAPSGARPRRSRPPRRRPPSAPAPAPPVVARRRAAPSRRAAAWRSTARSRRPRRGASAHALDRRSRRRSCSASAPGCFFGRGERTPTEATPALDSDRSDRSDRSACRRRCRRRLRRARPTRRAAATTARRNRADRERGADRGRRSQRSARRSSSAATKKSCAASSRSSPRRRPPRRRRPRPSRRPRRPSRRRRRALRRRPKRTPSPPRPRRRRPRRLRCRRARARRARAGRSGGRRADSPAPRTLRPCRRAISCAPAPA